VPFNSFNENHLVKHTTNSTHISYQEFDNLNSKKSVLQFNRNIPNNNSTFKRKHQSKLDPKPSQIQPIPHVQQIDIIIIVIHFWWFNKRQVNIFLVRPVTSDHFTNSLSFGTSLFRISSLREPSTAMPLGHLTQPTTSFENILKTFCLD